MSPHTGWGAVVAVAGAPGAPEVVLKRRVTMATTFETGAVYHVGQKLPRAEAEELVRSSERTFLELARAGLAGLVEELRGRGFSPFACAIVGPEAKESPALEQILRSHPLVHKAEGALYRRVLATASEACGVPASPAPAKELVARVARSAGLTAPRVTALLAAAGKASGRPWTKDQKEAALAAWALLAER